MVRHSFCAYVLNRKKRSRWDKGLSINNIDEIAPRFGLDLDGSIENKPRHSIAMVRFVRLRSVQRWPEDWMRDVKVIDGQALRGNLQECGGTIPYSINA